MGRQVFDDKLLALPAGTPLGVLATIKGDGRPQLSNVSYYSTSATSPSRSRSPSRGPRPATCVETRGHEFMSAPMTAGRTPVAEGRSDPEPRTPAAAPDDDTVRGPDCVVSQYRR